MSSMIENLNINERYFYVGEVIRDGKVIQSSAHSPNLVVDDGWAVVHASNSLMLYMAPCVGTGSTPPDVTDTALDSFLYGTPQSTTLSLAEGAVVVNSGNADGTVPRYSEVSQSFTWGLGAVVGNVTEVGLYVTTNRDASPPTGNLYSRALFLDGGGSPVTLTVTADDYLRLTIYRRRSTQQTDITGSFTYTLEGSPSSVGYTARPVGRSFSNLGGNASWNFAYNDLPFIPDGDSPLTTVGHQCIVWGVGTNLGRFASTATSLTFPTIWSLSGFTGVSSSFPETMAEPAVTDDTGDTVTVEGNFGPSLGNTTTIRGFWVGCGFAAWAIIFDSNLQKTNLQSIAFSFTVTFGRNTP